MRSSRVERVTKETDIRLELELDGSGAAEIETGVGMLDHMLNQLARHGGLDLTVKASGDLHVDAHHTVEDIAISLGRAINEALGERAGIARFADRAVPLDESLIHVSIDLSGRPYSVIGLEFPSPMSRAAALAHGDPFPRDGWRRRAASRCTSGSSRGRTDHHILEATFKALARCLRDAVRVVDRAGAPSTKGTLSG